MAKNKHPRRALIALISLSSVLLVTIIISSTIFIHQEITLKRQLDTQPELANIERINPIYAKVSDAINYVNWMTLANKFFDENGIVRSSLGEDDLANLSEKLALIKEPYKNLVVEKLEILKSEYATMKNTLDLVNGLFTSAERSTVLSSVTRAEYNDVVAHIEALKQTNLKNHFSAELEKVLPVIEEKERIAREKAEAERRAREEEQRKIAASWHRLNIAPYYINQFSAGYANGCEAASVLMAAKAKGRLTGYSLSTFADGMPKADDPNKGFYLSMTEPRDGGEAHWIAPAPLATYANPKGAGIYNVTGYSLDQLDAEVAAGNPVVIYLTYRYANPASYHHGVPDNLHVVVLSGFNSYTGEQQFYDPAPAVGTTPTLSKSRTEYLYAASGRRALVVK